MFERTEFDDDLWNDYCGELDKRWELNIRCPGFRDNPLLKLVAATPFLAKCDHPHRYAMAHLGVFLIQGLTPEPFDLRHGESMQSRLAPGMDFMGGDPTVIDRSRQILELYSLLDERKHAPDDFGSREPNTLIEDYDGKYNDDIVHERFLGRVNALEAMLDAFPNPVMDDIAKVKDLRDIIDEFRKHIFDKWPGLGCFWNCDVARRR